MGQKSEVRDRLDVLWSFSCFPLLHEQIEKVPAVPAESSESLTPCLAVGLSVILGREVLKGETCKMKTCSPSLLPLILLPTCQTLLGSHSCRFRSCCYNRKPL